jgi:hypothetical protein
MFFSGKCLLKRIIDFLAGTKFFVVCEPGTQHMEGLLKVIYELYTDYVLKNPFYEMEMPIRCELFDINLTQTIQKDRVALLGRWSAWETCIRPDRYLICYIRMYILRETVFLCRLWCWFSGWLSLWGMRNSIIKRVLKVHFNMLLFFTR